MQIRSLQLQNVKSYETLHVDFTPGINAVMGHNGAGKSTIVEAIGYALFDVLDYRADQFVREGAGDGKIALVFHSVLDGRAYRVERAIKGSQYNVSDCESNMVVVRGAEPVGGFIRHHLGLSETVDAKQLFKHAVGVAQGNLTAIFGEGAATRATVFNRLLEVEEYGAAFKALADTNAHLANLQNDTEKTIARLEGLLAPLPDHRRRAAEISRLQGEKSGMLSVRRKSLEQAEAERAGHEARKAAADQATQALRLAQMARATAVATLAQAQRERTAAQEAAAIVTANRAGHDRHVAQQQARDQLAKEQRARQLLLNSRAASEREQARAEAGVQQAQARLAQIAAAVARAAALHAPAEQQADLRRRLEQATTEAATLHGVQDALQAQTTQIARRRAQHATLVAQLKQADETQARISGLETTMQQLAVQLAEHDGTLNDVTAEGIAAKTHQEQLEAAGPICPICKRPIAEHLRDELLHTDIAVRERNKARILELRAARAKDAEARDKAESDRNQLIGALRSLADQKAVDAAAAELADLEQQRSQGEARLQSLAGAPALLAALKAELGALGDPLQERAVALAQAAQQAEVEQALSAALAQLHEQQAALVRLETQLAPFATLDADVELAEREVAATFDAYQALLAHQQAAQALPQRETAVQTAEAAGRQSAAALAQAEADAEQVGAAYSAEAHAQANGAAALHSQAVAGLSAELAMLKNEGEAKAAEIERLAGEERKLRSAEAERDQILLRQRTLAKLRSVIKEAGPHITRLRIRRVSAHAAALYSELTNDYASRLQWDEEYAIGLEVEGRVRAFKSLSGGEQMVAALAVRLALLREMSGIRMAFFDEPTANLDPTRRERLAQQLSAIKGFEQIFVISHDDTFDSSTVNVVRLSKENGATRLHAA